MALKNRDYHLIMQTGEDLVMSTNLWFWKGPKIRDIVVDVNLPKREFRMQLKNYKYPFVFISICIISGIIAGKNLIIFPLSLWLTLIFFLFSLFSYWLKRTVVLNIFLGCTLICAASLRYHLSAEIFPEQHIIHQKIEYVSGI